MLHPNPGQTTSFRAVCLTAIAAAFVALTGCSQLVAEPPRQTPVFRYCSVPVLAKSLDTFAEGLDNAFTGAPPEGFAENCADCHREGTANGQRELWGMSDATWAVAVTSLLARDAHQGRSNNSLERHISEVGTEHSLSGDALCDTRAFINGFFDAGGYGCEPCDEAQEAYDDFLASDMLGLMSRCTSCHGGTYADPNGYGGVFLYETADPDGGPPPDETDEERRAREAAELEERLARFNAPVWGSPINSGPGWFNALTRLTTRSLERAIDNAGEDGEIDVTTFSLSRHLDVVVEDANPYSLHHNEPDWVERAARFSAAFSTTVGLACVVGPPPEGDPPKAGCEPPCEPYVPTPQLSCATYTPLAPLARSALWAPEVVDAFTGPACASCHVEQAQGGVQWPAAANAGDLETALGAFMVQPVLGTPILPQQTSLGVKVLVPQPNDANHFGAFTEGGFDCTELGALTEMLIDGYANGECAGGPEPEPEPEPDVPVGCDEAYSQQVWTDSDLGGAAVFPPSCTDCHDGTPDEVGSTGTWGTTTGDWHDAARCSVSRDAAAAMGAADTKLYQAVDATLPPPFAHIGAPDKLAEMTTWITYRLENCSDFVCPAP